MQHDDKLYLIAMQCAKKNNEGCSCECQLCQFNIFNYIPDVREASLIKACAYTDFQNSQEAIKQTNRRLREMQIAPLFKLINIIVFIISCIYFFRTCVLK